MARVLITGGAGFVGSHTAKEMAENGHEVWVLDAFYHYIQPPVEQTYVTNINYRFKQLLTETTVLRGNTQNKDHLRRQLLEVQPEYIIHFAALPLANMAIEYSEEAFNTIVGGTVNLLEVIRDTDFLKRFVYISSSMVYGDFETFPVPEDAKKEPKDIYGGMKLSGEYMTKVYSQRYNIPYTIIRPSAIYGPTDNNKRVVGLFLSSAANGEKISAKNAENTFLDFSYVEDVAEGVRLACLADSAENETFNLTRGRGRSLQELIDAIKSLYPQTEVEYKEGNSFRPSRGALDISKAQKLLGYEPKIELEEGLKKYSEFLEKFCIKSEESQ